MAVFARKTEARGPEAQTIVFGVKSVADPVTTPPPLNGTNASAPAAEAGPTSKPHPDTTEAESIIGKDLSIEGQSITIRCKGSLHINGSIEAELHSRELTVGQFGTVTGTIAAESVDVFGRVSGAIKGTRVVLRSGAEVEGDIHAKSLSVEDGASFDGRSRRVSDPTAVAPQLEAGRPNTTPSGLPLPQ